MADNTDITNAAQDLESFNKESTTLVVTLQDLAKVLRENAKAAAEFTGESASAYEESFRSSISLGRQLSGYTADQLKNKRSEATFLKQLAKVEQERVRVQSKIGYLQDKALTASIEEQGYITKTVDIMRGVSDTLEAQVEHANELKTTFEGINKQVKAFDDLSDFFKDIPGVSKVFKEFQTAADAARAAAAEGGNAFKAGAKELNSVFVKGVSAFGISTALKGLKNIDERSVSLQRNLNKSAVESENISKNFNRAARGILGLSGTDLQKAAEDFSQALGTTAVISTGTAETLATQVKYMGMSTEEANKLANYSEATGTNLKQDTQQLIGQVAISNARNKTSIKYQAVMKDIAGTSNATKLLITGQGKSLTAAAIEAKKLGTTMEGIANIGKSMLDFESSIANELEAELLTGGEINNEKARALALMGDTEGLAKEVAKSGVLAKFEASKNVLQQEALAKAYGMSKEEMANMVVESKALSSLGAKDKSDLSEKVKLRLQEISTLGTAQERAKATADLSKQLGSDELIQKQNALTLAEKQEKVLNKVVEAMDFMSALLKPLGFVFKFMADNAEFLAKALLVVTGTAMIGKIANMAKMFRGMGSATQTAGAGIGKLTAGANGGGLAGAAGKVASQVAGGGGGVAGAAGAGGGVAGAAGKVAKVLSPKQLAAGFGGKAAMGAGAEAAGVVTKGGGFFSNLIKGGKGLLGKINPVMALKAATKEAGGFSKLLGKAVKGSALNTILTGFFAYNDIKDLVNNPVDENGKPLGEKAVNQKVGQIAAGGLGGILGGMIGTVVGGPIGAMVGSFGGEWLFKSLAEAFPEALEGLGGLISPLVKDKSKTKAELPKHAKGGIFTSASAGIIGEAGPEAVVPLTGFYNKIDQLITAVQVQKKEQAPRPVQQNIDPLTSFSNKIDQLASTLKSQKKEEAPKPVQEINFPLTGFSNKVDQLIAAMQLQKKEQAPKPVQQNIDPLTGFSGKIDQLVSTIQLQKRGEVVKPVQQNIDPLTSFSNKVDQLANIIKSQKKEEAPKPVQEITKPVQEINIPLTGFSNKIDQLITAVQLQKKQEAPKPVQEITKPVQEITLPLTGFSNKIDQLITAMQLQKKEEVVKPVQEITLPLTGFSNKIDQLIAAMQLQKRTEVVKSNNLTDKPIPAPVAVPVAKPVQELKPLTVKEPAAPIIQPKPIVTREIQSTTSNTEIVGLLKELITATKQGKPVYLDSNRVNAALGQSMYTVGG